MAVALKVPFMATEYFVEMHQINVDMNLVAMRYPYEYFARGRVEVLQTMVLLPAVAHGAALPGSSRHSGYCGF